MKNVGKFQITNIFDIESFFRIVRSMDGIILNLEKPFENARVWTITMESQEFEKISEDDEIPMYELVTYTNKSGKFLATAERIF